MKLLLTDRFCQTAKSKTPQTDYFDVTVRGLALRVTLARDEGLDVSLHKREQASAKDTWPVSGSQPCGGAGTLASEAATAVAEGRDPRYAAGSMTLGSLAQRYITHIRGIRTARETERRIRRDIISVIGNVALSE